MRPFPASGKAEAVDEIVVLSSLEEAVTEADRQGRETQEVDRL
jgi:hypothetical protein